MFKAKLVPVKSQFIFFMFLLSIMLKLSFQGESVINVKILTNNIFISNKNGDLSPFPFEFGEDKWISTVYFSQNGPTPNFNLAINYELPDARLVLKNSENTNKAKLESGDSLIITYPGRPLMINVLDTKVNINSLHNLKGMEAIMAEIKKLLLDKPKKIYNNVLAFELNEIDDTDFKLKDMYTMANSNLTLMSNRPDFLKFEIEDSLIEDKIKYFHRKTKGLADHINSSVKNKINDLDPIASDSLDAMTEELKQYLADANQEASNLMQQQIEQRLNQTYGFVNEVVKNTRVVLLFDSNIFAYPPNVVGSTSEKIELNLFIEKYIMAFQHLMQDIWVDVNNVRHNYMHKLTTEISSRLTNYMTQLYQKNLKNLKGLNDTMRDIKKQVSPLMNKIFSLNFINEIFYEKVKEDLTEYIMGFFNLGFEKEHLLYHEDDVFLNSITEFYSLINGPYRKNDGSDSFFRFAKIQFKSRILI